jgi:dUTP pyrophosphatase
VYTFKGISVQAVRMIPDEETGWGPLAYRVQGRLDSDARAGNQDAAYPKWDCLESVRFWAPARQGVPGHEMIVRRDHYVAWTESGEAFTMPPREFTAIFLPEPPGGKATPTGLRFMRVNSPPDWPLPSRGTPGSAGLDLSACMEGKSFIEPRRLFKVGTGWAVEIPPGFEGQIRPRSGLAFREGVTLFCQGTIDPDYRGELKLLMVNMGFETVTISPGQRLAQLVVSPCLMAEPEVAGFLSETVRGRAGFGSTGD